MVKTLHHILLEHNNNYFLPKSKENRDFDGKEFQKSRVRTQRLMQGMVEKYEIVERIRSRSCDYPTNTR